MTHSQAIEPLVLVYQITNRVNGHRYIGYTGRGLKARRAGHLSQLARGSHYAVHRAMRKYGVDNFDFSILGEFGDDEELAKVYEIEAIAAYKPEYNLSYGGEGGTLAEESKKKIGAANRGRKMPPSHGEKRRAFLTGRKHTPQAKAKIAAANRGKPSPLKGIPLKAETRAKISAANKGQVPWTAGRGHSPETRAKMSAWQIGRKLPDSHRASISKVRKDAWETNREKYLPAVRAAAAKAQAARKLSVRCVEDGAIFPGCSDADRHYGYRVGTVSRIVKGTIKNTTGRTFVRHEANDVGE